MNAGVPFTGDDLRNIAKSLDEWERLLVDKDRADYKPRAALVSRIEVLRPFDEAEVIGHFVLVDGWVGFQFKEGVS